jgi:hypothetical protein
MCSELWQLIWGTVAVPWDWLRRLLVCRANRAPPPPPLGKLRIVPLAWHGGGLPHFDVRSGLVVGNTVEEVGVFAHVTMVWRLSEQAD